MPWLKPTGDSAEVSVAKPKIPGRMVGRYAFNPAMDNLQVNEIREITSKFANKESFKVAMHLAAKSRGWKVSTSTWRGRYLVCRLS